MRKYQLLLLSVFIHLGLGAQSFSFDFETISNLQFISRSQPSGTLSWSRGYPANANTAAYFKAYAGTDSSYLSNSFQAADAAGLGGATISEWFILPTRTVHDGDTLSFWTRAANFSGTFYPDRLQVRAALNASPNVGVNALDTGDFVLLLKDINPDYSPSGYPTTWTKQTCILEDVAPGNDTYTFALRYFVEDGGPAGNNSGIIGIDEVKFSPSTTVGVTPALQPHISLKAYPNPCTTELYVDFGYITQHSVSCTLSNQNGQILGHAKFQAGTSAHRLDVSSLPSGLYSISLEDGSNLATCSFVKQ